MTLEELAELIPSEATRERFLSNVEDLLDTDGLEGIQDGDMLYHPGTGTYFAASETRIFNTEDVPKEAIENEDNTVLSKASRPVLVITL